MERDPTCDEVTVFTEAVDKNGDNKLSLNEYISYVYVHGKGGCVQVVTPVCFKDFHDWDVYALGQVCLRPLAR